MSNNSQEPGKCVVPIIVAKKRTPQTKKCCKVCLPNHKVLQIVPPVVVVQVRQHGYRTQAQILLHYLNLGCVMYSSLNAMPQHAAQVDKSTRGVHRGHAACLHQRSAQKACCVLYQRNAQKACCVPAHFFGQPVRASRTLQTRYSHLLLSQDGSQ
eukprot:1159911-Pelagomonas_calceolata.AAC.22